MSGALLLPRGRGDHRTASSWRACRRLPQTRCRRPLLFLPQRSLRRRIPPRNPCRRVSRRISCRRLQQPISWSPRCLRCQLRRPCWPRCLPRRRRPGHLRCRLTCSGRLLGRRRRPGRPTRRLVCLGRLPRRRHRGRLTCRLPRRRPDWLTCRLPGQRRLDRLTLRLPRWWRRGVRGCRRVLGGRGEPFRTRDGPLDLGRFSVRGWRSYPASWFLRPTTHRGRRTRPAGSPRPAYPPSCKGSVSFPQVRIWVLLATMVRI